jgi:hypothetical protein
LDGQLELKRGPVRCNRAKASRSLQTALELFKESKDPADQVLAETARQQLTVLNEFNRHHSHPFFEDEDPYGEATTEMDPEGLPDAISSGFLRELIEEMCKKLGLDLEQVLARFFESGELPGPFAGRSRQPFQKGKRR